jgi:hypothetical protein
MGSIILMEPQSEKERFRMKKATLLMAVMVLLAAAIPAQADIPVEFGRGSELIGALSIDESTSGVSERQTVVIEFFRKDPRDLADFLCYEAELRELQNRNVVGYGIDCLAISPTLSDPLPGALAGDEHETPGLGGQALSPQIDAVTFFFLPSGHLVADGLTTVRPVFDGVGSGGVNGPIGKITHITGSIPGNKPNLVAASGIYKALKSKAKVRLSGAVNTDSFFTTNDNQMAFSCIFVVITD